MKIRFYSLLVASALLLPAFSMNAAVRQGMVEVGFDGNYSKLDIGDKKSDSVNSNISVGYFATDVIEISGLFGYTKTKFDGDKARAIELGGAVDYHFMPRTDFVPFVGAGVDWIQSKVSGAKKEDDWAWNVHVGAKHFIARSVAIKYQVSYVKYDKLDIDGFTAGIGLSVFFN